MEIRVADGKYIIKFAYDPDKVEQVKTLGNPRWNPREKFWTASRDKINAEKLKNMRWYDDEEILSAIPQLGTIGGTHTWTISNRDLYEHQKKWHAWCATVPRCLLDGDPGVGKTLMTMLWWQAHGVAPQDILVVCPSSLMYNWQREIAEVTGEQASLLTGSPKKLEAALKTPGIHVINYERVFSGKALRPELAALKKRVLVIDESHRLKNPQALTSKLLWKLSKDMAGVILLTGTPVSQGAHDYFSQFRVVNEAILGPGFSAFKGEFCETQQVWGAPAGVTRITGYRNLPRLMGMLKPYMFSVRKDECLDLPPKTYETIRVGLSVAQQKSYNAMKDEFITDVGNSVITAQNILPRLSKLQQICQGFVLDENRQAIRFSDNPKIEAVEDVLSRDEKPCVIMCRFKEDAAILSEMCAKWRWSHCVINGDTNREDRNKFVNSFEAGEIRILIGQIQTAGTGLNLVASDTMIFYCNDYSLVNRIQAESRTHRLGARGETCHYIDIVARGTIDEQVAAALERKQDLAAMLNKVDVSTLV